MTSSDIQDLGSLLETARKFRERGHFKAVIDLVQTLIDTEDVSWEFYWELALAAKELGLVDVVDQATAEVMLKNSEFWFARELPKQVRGYYSQLGQDEIVERFFAAHPPKSRVFVEVGAFDGVHYSNVRRLQETYGWSGISIEPVEQNFEKLSKSYTGRPVVCVRCAVGDKEGVAELNVSSYPHLPDWGSDVATFSESETQRWQQTYGAVWHKEQVPVKTLTSVLQENNIGVIDFLSVDAEGHDLDVLKGLDFSIYRPKLIVVEYNRHRQEIFDFLADNGYRLFKDNGQDLFMELVVESNFSVIDTIPLSASDDDMPQSLEHRDRVLKTLSCHEAVGLIVAASPNVLRIPPVAISRFGRQPAAGSGRPTMNADVCDKLNPHLLALGTLPLDKPIRRFSTTPLDLLTSSRFDIIPKFVYAGFREFGIDSSWGKELYEAHLCAFNDCNEGDGSGKVGFESFKDVFDSLLDSVKAGGFDSRISLVPTGRNGVIIDGAHRVAACMLYCQPVEILEFDLMANCYNYEYFLGKGLNSDFCDAIALAFCQLKSQAYIVSVFPSAVGKELEIQEILERNGEIFYARQVQLSRLGSVNLVRQMYDGEHWVGNFANRFEGAQNKAAECFRTDGPVRVYVFTSDDFEKVKAAKQQIRDLFGISNHSVHINDTHEETVRLGRLLLNANSVHFLNNAQLTSFPRFQTHLENYKKVLREKGIAGEYLCIDGSAVMAAYGIREARDLDYLHFGYNDLTFDYPPELIGSHNSEIAHHVTTRDDIIFNPSNHFYYDGVKFASLGIIRAMKEKREEPKDYEDVALIDRFVITPPSPPHVNIPAVPAAGVVRQPKIVGLVPARNEKHAIAQCLRALSLFTDAIVYLDDASTDETPDIVASLASQCRIERIIRKKEWHRDEPGDRNAMLRAGREIGGTHFIVIDADEMLTSNLLGSPGLRDAILKLQPGDRLALNWIQLWRSIDQYRFDQSVWTWNYKDIIFCDDGRCSYSSEFIHTPRAPGNLSGNRYTIQGYEAGLLHFQFVNWRNLLVKQAWYRCLEHIREPEKPVTEINERYAPSKEESGLGLVPSPAAWFSGYPFFDRTVYDRLDEWREAQIFGWFRQYGKTYFADLDIWDVEWVASNDPQQLLESCSPFGRREMAGGGLNGKTSNEGRSYRVTAIVSTYRSEAFMRGCLEDLVNQTLHRRGELEIIVIDSASPENEGAIIHELQGRYDNIRYLRTEQRETVYAAWNRAIGMARGRYITNANTDDRHRRDAFELMVRVLENDPAVDLVYADVIITRTPHETYEQHTPAGRYSWYEWDRNTLLDNGCFIGPQPMWRRSVHELYGGFDESYVTSGDYEFWLRISQTSSFRHINQPLGLYLAHPDSIEHRNEDRKQLENQQLLNLYLQSANTGTLVGFKPLQQLNALCGQVKPPELVDFDVAGIVATIDKLVSKGRSLPDELRERYLESRLTVVNGDISQRAVTAYAFTAEQAVLASQEWFVRRRAVYGGMKREEAAVRHTVRSEAMRQAELLVQRGAPDAAVDVLISKGIRSATDDPSVYGFLADLLLAANRFQDVLALLPEMPVASDPALIWELQALSHAALGDEAAADNAARQALALGGNRARSLVVLGTLAARDSAQLHAEGYFAQALEQDPACASAWLSSGILLWGKGERGRAWKAIRRAVEVNPLVDQAMTVFLETAARTERLQDALQSVLEAVTLYPDSRNLAVVRAKLLSQCGYDDKALQACESFLVRFGIDEEVLELALELRRKVGEYGRLQQVGSESVSLCMIVKNEDVCLACCLASVKPVVHELVVVDTGSSDHTVAIATAFGAKVSYFHWNGSFSDARNFGLDQAGGAWVLVLDADEVLSTQDHEKIRELVSKSDIRKAYSVLTRNYTTMIHAQGWTANDSSYPMEERADGWQPSWKVRLFPHDSRFRFCGEVHEMVETSLRNNGIQLQRAPFVVHHYGLLEQDPVKQIDKKLHYFEIGLQKLAQNPGDLAAICELAVQAGELGRFEEGIDLWDRLLQQHPDYVEALFNKGYCLMGLQRYVEALDSSRRALELDPNHKEAAFNYGTCELYAGDPQRGLTVIKPFAAQHPEYPLLQALLVALCSVCGENETAWKEYAKLKQRQYGVDGYLQQHCTVLDGFGRPEYAMRIKTAVAAH